VDGDLQELDPEVLAKMRGEILDMDAPYTVVPGLPRVANLTNAKRHDRNKETQAALRESIAWWAGIQRRDGRCRRESERRFFHLFKIDVLGAQALKAADALMLADKVNKRIGQEL